MNATKELTTLIEAEAIIKTAYIAVGRETGGAVEDMLWRVLTYVRNAQKQPLEILKGEK